MSLSLLAAVALAISTPENIQDTLKTVSLDEINVVSNIKETGTLRQQPASTTYLSQDILYSKGATGMKSLGTLAPNLFMPDYGSKQTSAIYMRGIGSRIGNPSVGLYMDNVPFYEKSAFDFSFYDIESIDILRGPQSTLYGRNAMSGLIRVHTRNPLYYNGTDIRLGFASKENRRQASVTHYHHVNDKLAFSAGGFYDGGDGFFRNALSDKKTDGTQSGGGRIRAIFKANERLSFDGNISYEYSDEGAYPYFYTGTVDGNEQYGDYIGKISANLEGRYRRGLLNASVNTSYKTEAITLNSVTAYQNINDRMFMDQDFLADDIYSLEQKQKIGILSEELILKNNGKKAWNWLIGANFFRQWQNIKAPVTFRKDGVAWLNSTINTNANKYMPPVAAGPMTMNFVFADNIQGEALRFDDDFETPTTGLALFHQSTLNDLLGVEGLSASVGLRLDYEKMNMDYKAWYDFEHIYSLKGLLTPMNKEVTMVPEQTFHENNSSLKGTVSNDYLEFLPKVSLMYSFDAGNVYATMSRGYRSGGYNAQNISELLRMQMQTDMMRNVRDVTVPILEKQPMVPADKKETIKEILDRMATETPADVEGSCSYKPEYAWNYEIGTHLNFLDRTLTMDFTAFLSNISDLQLSKMSATGLGRTIHNAGKSRSIGIETALRFTPVKELSLGIAYGYTHSTFKDYAIYDDGQKKEIDCNGNYVPYIPSSTLNLDAAYAFQINKGMLKSLTVGADYSFAGKIYWDEQNLHSQDSYGIMGARIQLDFGCFDLQLWGRNLTNSSYNTFWFESMKRGFEQHGKPLQLGATASLHI